MKHYKLINTQTKEEHLCDKITIDGFDYYVSDEQATEGFYGYINFQDGDIKKIGKYFADDWKKVIATTNPKINVPKVVNRVEELANLEEAKEYSGVDPLDPCGYSGTDFNLGFISGHNKSQETHPFSEEDMIEFLDWKEQQGYVFTSG